MKILTVNERPMRRLIFVFLAMLFIVISGTFYFCRPRTSLNVVLISIDTLRPDHLGCYGYSWETSPTIDRLAEEGVLFENAFSSTTWTLPAHLALLTSLPDLVHGVMTEAFLLDQDRITLAEILKEQGYSTYGIFTGPLLLPRWGFGQGFDNYVDATLYDKSLDGPQMMNASERDRTTPEAMKNVELLLDKNGEKPFFLFLHLFDCHPDFVPPAPYDTMFDPDYTGNIHGVDIMNNPDIQRDMDPGDLNHLLALYDGEIRFVDEVGIAGLLGILKERGILEKTLIVITADHGEEFFEHGVFGHRQNLYDTTLQIPLIIWCPERIPAGMRIKNQVRIIDIMPTILDLLAAPQSPEGLGQSLIPLMNDQDGLKKERPLFAVLKDYKRYQEALRTEKYKMIRDYMREERMYIDLEEDPEEVRPSTDQNLPEFQEGMNRFFFIRLNLTSYSKTLPWNKITAPKMDPELIERLKSLGYIKDK